MPAPVEITERLLNDAGGWQTMKQARSLHSMGRVAGVSWEPPLLRGAVREGEREFRSGLRIVSKTHIENLCSCRPSREHGLICPHAIAVGLEWITPVGKGIASLPAVPSAGPAQAQPPSHPPAKPVFSLTAGEPVSLRIILPPNIVAAWAKGSVMAVIESLWKGKTVPLAALPKESAFQVSAADLRVIEGLRAFAPGETPGMILLSQSQFLHFLHALRGHPGVLFGKTAGVSIAPDPLRPPLRIEPQPTGAVRLTVALPSGASLMVAEENAWLVEGLALRELAPGLPAAYRPLLAQPVTLPEDGAGAFFQRELPALRAFLEIDDSNVPETAAHQIRPLAPDCTFALELEGSLNHLTAKLRTLYGDRAVMLTEPPSRSSGARNFPAELLAMEQLRAGGFSGPDATGQLVLKGEGSILAFFARDLPEWQRKAKVTIGARFAHVTQDVERLQPQLEVRSSGENWFELQVEMATEGGERFSASEIQRLLQSGQSHVRRQNGRLAVFDPAMLDEFQQTLTDCQPTQRQPGLYQVDQRQAGYLQAVADQYQLRLAAPPSWRKTVEEGQNLSQMRPVNIGALATVLRPYQADGVNWLNYLSSNGFGGILADEMGLGKTVQTLAFLQHLGGRALIVCPSSLVYNWAREAARFTPEQHVLTVEGASRKAAFGEPLAQANLVITSYALLRRDAELYRGHEFQAVVLDEAQHIKNPESQNAQAASGIRAKHRFALTGTPVENSVRDIWSLMNFLMPGYLGTHRDFRERYEAPIAAAPGGPEHARLVKRLRPFILRRRKQDVLRELPDKIEQVRYCDLGPQQRALYRGLLDGARRQVADLAGTKDQNKARIQILTALLRLRQACCDVRLLQSDAAGALDDLSGKSEALEELLLEAIDGGHRVLVFSQFVSMLQLLRALLEERGTAYCYLDGGTKNRGAEVDRFQTGENPVFLISLKAGGVGLNLTAADTVIHFDPWWNPAVEAQATDRAHRIGQQKVVTSYKLIARDTIEEKILALQQKKRQVIDATLESEEPLMQALTMTDLQELLE